MKDFIPYQEALALKELGFDELCFGWYDCYSKMVNYEKAHNSCGWLNGNHCSAPTYSQAFRFFRENYPHLNFGFDKIHSESENYHYHINYKWEFFEGSYEEAELECLKKLIEIVKEKQ